MDHQYIESSAYQFPPAMCLSLDIKTSGTAQCAEIQICSYRCTVRRNKTKLACRTNEKQNSHTTNSIRVCLHRSCSLKNSNFVLPPPPCLFLHLLHHCLHPPHQQLLAGKSSEGLPKFCQLAVYLQGLFALQHVTRTRNKVQHPPHLLHRRILLLCSSSPPTPPTPPLKFI